jgi:hypothetical protein
MEKIIINMGHLFEKNLSDRGFGTHHNDFIYLYEKEQ